MSIRKYRGKYVPICDCCSRVLWPEYFWDDAVMATREAGWCYNFEVREHTCPDCQKYLEKFKDERRAEP